MIIGLILLAAWLRFWQLHSIPPGLWFDEGHNAMDAVQILDTQTWPIFFERNQGQEPLFKYLVAVSITLFGQTTYSVRVISAFLGILAIALMYRWGMLLFNSMLEVRWIALLGAAGLAVSFIFLWTNRVGYRANSLVPFVLMTYCFFWQGWRSNKLHYYLLAGVSLGACYYTYTAARLFPLVFVLFVLVQTFLTWPKERAQLRRAWTGLFITLIVSLIIAVPLGFFFIDHPAAFVERTEDVSFKLNGSGNGMQEVGRHLLEAIRVFVDGGDPNWRHHLPERPAFDGLNIVGFYLGLWIVLRKYRSPVYLFLVVSLVAMWLPALLAKPAFHTLRLLAMLPAYYLLVAIGLLETMNWLRIRFLAQVTKWQAGILAFLALLIFSGGISFYDYFYNWANRPEVYHAFDGSLVELADYLTESEREISVIIPFSLYTHASVRYLLQKYYQEAILLPQNRWADLSQQEEIVVVMPENLRDDGKSPAFVWLMKGKTGPGLAYVSNVRETITPTQFHLEPAGKIKDGLGHELAQQYLTKTKAILPLFTQELPKKKAAFEWDNSLVLAAYEFMPAMIKSGEATSLYLAWQVTGFVRFKEKMFVQLINSQGVPVGQKEVEATSTSEKLYRWREDRLILEQIPLDFFNELDPGLYFVRFGFFNSETNQRLPVHNSEKQLLGDEVILGPLYVWDGHINPLTPSYSVSARLGDGIELLGYSIASSEEPASIEVQLYWQAMGLIDENYTAFVQLLDGQNKVIAQHDSQPLAGIYPTSRWQPGDILMMPFTLPIAKSHLFAANQRLVTGMYDLSSGIRLPTYDHADHSLPDGLIELIH
jgi:4-amino-4-deoxy-L-arabinose transferase-like glycosyltransferase